MSQYDDIIQKAVDEATKALSGQPGDVEKTTATLSTAQYGYSLEAPAKQLVPFLTPWQQLVPRFKVPTGGSHQYRRITNIAVTGKSTAAEGTVGNAAAYTADLQTVNFGIVSSGVHDITWEAEQAAGSFDNLRSRLVTNALLTGRRAESAHIFGGNVTALAAVDASVAVAMADNTNVTGTVANAAYYAYIKPLTAMAVQKAISAGLILKPTGTYNACHPAGWTTSAPTLTCDQTDGWGVESTVATATPTLNKGITLTWQNVPGACGYGIFLGTSSGITNAKLYGVTGQRSITMLNPAATGSSAGVSGDNSADANDFNGLINLVEASGSGSYVSVLGSTLSASQGTGIPEIDAMLESVYLQALGVDDGYLICGVQDRHGITYAFGQGAANNIARFMVGSSGQNQPVGGGFMNKYIHPVTGREIEILTDPWLCGGNIAFIPKSFPFPMADVAAPLAMAMSYDWTNFEYAQTAPKRIFENRMRGGLACYLPPAFGILKDVRRP